MIWLVCQVFIGDSVSYQVVRRSVFIMGRVNVFTTVKEAGVRKIIYSSFYAVYERESVIFNIVCRYSVVVNELWDKFKQLSSSPLFPKYIDVRKDYTSGFVKFNR